MNRGNVEYPRWFDLRPRFSAEGERQPGEEEDLLFAVKFKSPCRKPVSTRTRLAWVKNKPVGPFAGSIHANFASIRQAAIRLQWARKPMGLPARSGEKIRRSWLSVRLMFYRCSRRGLLKSARCPSDALPILEKLSQDLFVSLRVIDTYKTGPCWKTFLCVNAKN